MNRILFNTHSGIVAFPDRMHWTFAFLALLIGLMSGCSEPEKPPSPLTEVTVMQVQSKDTPVTFEFVGMTESSQQVEVRARVDGFLEERPLYRGKHREEGTGHVQDGPEALPSPACSCQRRTRPTEG